jgi:hypothetical protein
VSKALDIFHDGDLSEERRLESRFDPAENAAARFVQTRARLAR